MTIRDWIRLGLRQKIISIEQDEANVTMLKNEQSTDAVKSLDSIYLLDKVMAIIGALAKFGFIVDTITGDGASENRSVFKSLCTTSFKDFIK